MASGVQRSVGSSYSTPTFGGSGGGGDGFLVFYQSVDVFRRDLTIDVKSIWPGCTHKLIPGANEELAGATYELSWAGY